MSVCFLFCFPFFFCPSPDTSPTGSLLPEPFPEPFPEPEGVHGFAVEGSTWGLSTALPVYPGVKSELLGFAAAGKAGNASALVGGDETPERDGAGIGLAA